VTSRIQWMRPSPTRSSSWIHSQHDHPLLAALTLTSKIIAIEDWVLPSGTFPAAKMPGEYRKRLEERMPSSKIQRDAADLGLPPYLPRQADSYRSRQDQHNAAHRRLASLAHEFILTPRRSKRPGLTSLRCFDAGSRAETIQSRGRHFLEGGMFASFPGCYRPSPPPSAFGPDSN